MKRALYRYILFVIFVMLAVAGIFFLRKPHKISKELDLLTPQQRAAIIKGLPASSDMLTPDSPAVDTLRQSAKDANVVICVLDAARADHFGCYGYARETTPNFDKLAKESYLFANHFSQYTLTVPSTECLFSSQYPDTHGMPDPSYDEKDGNGDIQIKVPREPSFTFPIGLEAAGYRTVLLTGSGRASPAFGIGLGFSEGYYHRSLKPFIRKDERRYTPTVLLRALESWLGRNSDARFFLYIHFGPPHRPYEQPAKYTRLFEQQVPPGFFAANYAPGKYLFPLRVESDPADGPPLPEWINLYDANLRYGDWAIGEVKKLLEKHGRYDKTLLIITSDHGESFGEHGFVWHAGGIYNEATHIPLLIRLPGRNAAAKRIGALTQTIDILPTVYDLLQTPFPKREVQGKTLLPLMSGSKQAVHETSFTRSDGPPKYMVRDLHNSLLVYANPQWRALYNTDTDPELKKNIIAAEPQKAQALYQTFLKFANAQKYPPTEFSGVTARRSAKRDERNLNLTPEMQRDLKSLGYLK